MLKLNLSHVTNQISSDDTYYAYEIRKLDKLIVISKKDLDKYEFLNMAAIWDKDKRNVLVKRFDFRIPIVHKIDYKIEFLKSFKEFYINENQTK